MKLLSVASLAFIGLAKFVNAQESEEAAGDRHYPVLKKGVRAAFTDAISGATGSVTIYDSTDISADIEITDFAKIPTWANCSSGGIKWSLNSEWSSPGEEETGASCTGAAGPRYDPNFACSPQSQYFASICNWFGPNVAMTDYLTTVGGTFPSPGKPACSGPIGGQYNCWPCLYKQFSSACEVGDLSGKYGNLMFHTGCVREAAEGEEGAVSTEAQTDQAAGYNYNNYNNYEYCHQGTHVDFTTHDRFMNKPSVFRARSILLSCSDDTPLMCAVLKPFTGY
jgi:hypothetical protein